MSTTAPACMTRSNRWRLNSARAEVDADHLYVLTLYDGTQKTGGADATREFVAQARRHAGHSAMSIPVTLGSERCAYGSGVRECPITSRCGDPRTGHRRPGGGMLTYYEQHSRSPAPSNCERPSPHHRNQDSVEWFHSPRRRWLHRVGRRGGWPMAMLRYERTERTAAGVRRRVRRRKSSKTVAPTGTATRAG